MVTHFEQRQLIVTEVEGYPLVSRRKQRMLDSEEVVKEKNISEQKGQQLLCVLLLLCCQMISQRRCPYRLPLTQL
ncbi:hypothetical protein OPV22_015128 [Ensete ventricosum]|uniref:Uncharacterized protein n=1 Tax=Ensete ventricosum TaxID=4639 RepID=A0AAV8RCY1_ENSVE|nr:hypothetical protein OPV22_015128 [Ensete ventricosum]